MNSINFVPHVVVIGGGPAGLMAAETLAQGGAQVDVFDAMPSVGRKFLLAGKGGLNLTHAEDLPDFLRRYGDKQTAVTSWINEFNPQNCRQWAKQLGIETFVGTSGRVFPQDMKAAPLLRAWLHRMRAKGIRFHMRHRWIGWHEGSLRFSTPNGNVVQRADAVVLALGGASWPQLGSNGAWVPLLQQGGVDIAPLEPTNCGFEVNWSDHFKTNFAGEPLSPIAITYTNEKGTTTRRLGQFVVTEHGVEGSLIYALSSLLRDQIKANGSTQIHLDLLPDLPLHRAVQHCEHPRGSRSVAGHLQSRLNLRGVKTALLREFCSPETLQTPVLLANAIKALPITLLAPRPIAEVISTAGGVKLDAMNRDLMLTKMPGVFCAGEMLDWEAPTGGYLLTACLASGKVAGKAALTWLKKQK
ncbi:TIGR03862 family flavoprotein [Sapientia aquatica]|uniref:TIGR03862 family flavoprotein n=1 Tax=Sapientia aquatica TaxID=1549640 RepID=A0A4R5W2R9_9BURK|nr:TIGR03862 family flavoprotein [Sapientia aquatica]TDK66653.1 TIGR03862 family flavoprotein [Sapientia aquatica]